MIPSRDQVSQRNVEHIFDVLVVHITKVVEQVVEVPEISSQAQNLECTAEQALDVLVHVPVPCDIDPLGAVLMRRSRDAWAEEAPNLCGDGSGRQSGREPEEALRTKY